MASKRSVPPNGRTAGFFAAGNTLRQLPVPMLNNVLRQYEPIRGNNRPVLQVVDGWVVKLTEPPGA